MPFKPVQSEKISLAVVRQIELLILRGILRPGERLPADGLPDHIRPVSKQVFIDFLSPISEREK